MGNTLTFGKSGKPTIKTTVKNDTAPASVPSTDPRDYPLTQRQFNRFAALYDYDDVIDGILKALKPAPMKSLQRQIYAQIKGDIHGAKQFRFQVILDLIGSPDLASLIPEGVDVTEETLAARWLLAKDY